MKRVLLASIVPLFLLSIISLGWTVTDLGESGVTRLWRSTNNGDEFICSAVYIRMFAAETQGRLAWIVTAGHCVDGGARLIKRSATDWILSYVNWRFMILSYPGLSKPHWDLAIGSAPEIREKSLNAFWLANEFPQSGSAVYIHGFPGGIERVIFGRVVMAEWAAEQPGNLGIAAKAYTGSQLVMVQRNQIFGGSSGSAVLSENGSLVGIVWGAIEIDSAMEECCQAVIVTPVETIQVGIKLLGG